MTDFDRDHHYCLWRAILSPSLPGSLSPISSAWGLFTLNSTTWHFGIGGMYFLGEASAVAGRERGKVSTPMYHVTSSY